MRIARLGQSELEEKLRALRTDEWRVQRMARTEISRADAPSSVEAMKQANQTGTLIESDGERDRRRICYAIDKWRQLMSQS